MADKSIGDLTPVEVADTDQIDQVADSSKIPVEQDGALKHMTGAQWKAYATEAVQPLTAAAEDAKDAAVAAKTATEAIQTNITTTVTDNVMDEIDPRIEAIEQGLEDVAIDPDRLGLYQDADGLVYVTYDGVASSNGIPLAGGGGGGGGSGNNAVLTVTNENPGGWISKTISNGASIAINLSWSSLENGIPTGSGTLTVKNGNVVVSSYDVEQGDLEIDVTNYISVGSNKIKVGIADVYGNSRTLAFTITSVDLSLTSSFDPNVTYTAGQEIQFPYIPRGTGEKTVFFYVDGTKVAEATVNSSGRQNTQILSGMTHGSHSIRVYFAADVGGTEVTSNELYYDIIVADAESSRPIISTPFRETSVAQYTTLNIPYRVYNPASLDAVVELYVGATKVSTLTVDRTEQTWVYRPDEVGTTTLTISTTQDNVTVTRQIQFAVTETQIDVHAVTDDLALYLTSYGRSNNEEHPEVWEYGNISATLTGFNWTSNGWVQDESGITVLRVSGEARVTIPYKLFQNDFRNSGKTIEIEFATRDVRNYDAAILSCYSGGRGIVITAQRALLQSEQTSLSTQHKEDEHVRLSFVVNKRGENRLMYIYINGIMSGAIQYADNDDFSQTNPVNISIGSSDCTIDIYNVRVYDNNLNRQQVLDNWIADSQILDDLLYRYNHNNVYDEYGNVVIEKLPKDLPYMVLVGSELPQYKGDKKTVDVTFTDLIHPEKSFSATGVEIDVQGTSSAPYARKNYDQKYKLGFNMANGQHVATYAIRNDIMPGARFVVKADVASSESVNNTGLTCLFNDTTPYKTPEMLADSRVRIGIYGRPIVIFWTDTTTNRTVFLGKYNFNWPKRFPEGLGFTGNMESWEWQNNTSNRVLFKSADFDEQYTDPDTGVTIPAWRNDFEARFPSDDWTDIRKLKEWLAWVVTTDRDQASGATLPAPVTYDFGETDGEGNPITYTYTQDTAAYRLHKFKAECADYVEMDSAIFYYIFTEVFLLADSRAKNMFPSFNGSAVTSPNIHYIDRKVVFMPYDMDTGLGTNNEGTLTYDYSLEDTDTVAGEDVFTGQQSVFWQNIRDAFPAEIVAMYRALRSQNKLSYPVVEAMYEAHQAVWPEAIFNEDSVFKYIDPLIAPDAGKDPTDFYLPMLQGSKEEQRKWWLYNRFRYMDSKWNAGDALSDVIQLRGYAKANITVTPYADIYPTVKYGSYLVQQRGHRGTPTTLVCPLDNVSDTEIYIYSASQLASVGDLSGLKVGVADFSKATRLQSVKLGDASASYSNPNLKSLSFGNNVLLSSIDARNCTSDELAHSVDVSGCSNLEAAYFGGTKITGLILPNGGVLKTLQLPGTITNLTIQNQRGITSFECPSYASITTLRLENVSDSVPMMTILNAIPANSRVRLIGIALTMTTTSEVEAFYALLDTMRGLDEQGNNVDTAQVSGVISGLGTITGEWLAQMQARYPNVSIQYQHINSKLYYYNGNTLVNTETITDGGDGTYNTAQTKASTAQYTYTFVGWSKQQDSEIADPNATKSVTADRSVYAAYTKTVRTYTVTFKNGSTTLQTVQNVPYGGSATYTGETPVDAEHGYPFDGWNPEPTNIVGNTVCMAHFDVPYEVSEITDSWETIMAKVANGTAASTYKIGMYKPIDLGAQGIINMQIAGRNVDELANGNGTAQLTWVAMELLKTKHRWNPSAQAVYEDREIDAWKLFYGKKYASQGQNSATIGNQNASWSVTAETAGTLTVSFYCNNTVNGQLLTVTINGATYSTSRYDTSNKQTVECAQGDVVNVSATYNNTKSNNEYGLVDFSSTGTISISFTTEKIIAPVATGEYVDRTGGVGGWEKCELREYLKNTIKPLIPQTVRSAIKEVTKGQTTYPQEVQISSEDVWILSMIEICGFSGTPQNQPRYELLFPNNTARKRWIVGSTSSTADYYWTRTGVTKSSSGGYGKVYEISTNGSYVETSTASSYGICLCFCT